MPASCLFGTPAAAAASPGGGSGGCLMRTLPGRSPGIAGGGAQGPVISYPSEYLYAATGSSLYLFRVGDIRTMVSY